MSNVHAVVGLGFGDEGKGTIVDWLAREARNEQPDSRPLVVRFNGGAQAGHNVVLPDGRHHEFAMFGSGTLAESDTFLSRYVLVNPFALMNEAVHLGELGVRDVHTTLTIDMECMITTPYHTAVNRLKEMRRGDQRHGSCGRGIGETMLHQRKHPDHVLRIGDLLDPVKTSRRLAVIRSQCLAEVEEWVDELSPSDVKTTSLLYLHDSNYAEFYQSKYNIFAGLFKKRFVRSDWLSERAAYTQQPIIFEGAQGVLLDQDAGFQPYVTWSDCTLNNVIQLTAGWSRAVNTIGVIRSYMTRHGAGPLPTEREEMSVILREYHRSHNREGQWQGRMRVGRLDEVLLRYALGSVGGVNEIAMTHIDVVGDPSPVVLATSYTSPLYPGAGGDDELFIYTSDDRIDQISPLPVSYEPSERQLRRTEALSTVTPVYTSVPHNSELPKYLRPSIISYGPTHLDKQIC